MPNVYIIAGPNGAGKTTFAREFLPNYTNCRQFVNADLIAQGMSPFSPETAEFRAGRLMLREIDLYMKRCEDFGYETTLSGHSHLNLIRRLKNRGYELHLFFLWIRNVQISLQRVKDRVLRGGHDVPAAVVHRRFDRSIKNFFVCYRPLAASWTLFDSSDAIPKLIAFENQNKISIINARLYNELVARYEEK